jgi:hypothetical protein
MEQAQLGPGLSQQLRDGRNECRRIAAAFQFDLVKNLDLCANDAAQGYGASRAACVDSDEKRVTQRTPR